MAHLLSDFHETNGGYEYKEYTPETGHRFPLA